MRYLVGSAFLEWLVERKGDESLPHLWRRMSARVDRWRNYDGHNLEHSVPSGAATSHKRAARSKSRPISF